MAKSRVENTKKGTCRVCKRRITSSRMGVHLRTHIPNVGKPTHYIIGVSDKGLFWMFLQVPATYTLTNLDAFLRAEWLECCGHLSMFDVDGTIYDSSPDDEYIRNKSMNYKLRDVLAKGAKIRYEYDFGTTTTLWLTVTAARVSPPVSRKGIAPLAVHDKVRFNCDVCGREATKVCSYCTIYADGSMMCDNCVGKHTCVLEDEDAVLNLVQSPRVGMCAYDSEPPTLHHQPRAGWLR